MSDDLVARLKTKSVWGKFGWEPDDDSREAAAEIERLTAEIAEWKMVTTHDSPAGAATGFKAIERTMDMLRRDKQRAEAELGKYKEEHIVFLARAQRAEAERDALLTAIQSARDFVCIHEGELIGTVYLQLVHDMNAAIDAARGKQNG